MCERGNTEELLWTAVWTLLAVGTGRWPKLGWEKRLCKDKMSTDNQTQVSGDLLNINSKPVKS